jgi:predicted TIM-barrel fold metal-dependent hydrolase
VSGITPIQPGFPDESCAKMIKWIKNGPCIGIKYVGGNDSGIACSHPNSDPIIRLAAELNATIYIHTWLKIGGTPRLPGRDNLPGESTPMDVVALAKRHPNVRFICGHSGGDWELGVRVVRPQKNVLLEFAGSDPHSGSVDYAVKELGVDRIVWGGHGPSRSYSTEFGKVLDADLSRADRMKVFGGNFRQLAAPIFRQKGNKIEV